jgi:hypothetical protein
LSAAKSFTKRDIMPWEPDINSTSASLAWSQPDCPNACLPISQISHSPNSQVRIIAGVMMKRSSRRSITLKVSDCRDPASASQ